MLIVASHKSHVNEAYNTARVMFNVISEVVFHNYFEESYCLLFTCYPAVEGWAIASIRNTLVYWPQSRKLTLAKVAISGLCKQQNIRKNYNCINEKNNSVDAIRSRQASWPGVSSQFTYLSPSLSLCNISYSDVQVFCISVCALASYTYLY